eukprot:6534155-Prymnesium_polylepis.1
MDRCYEAGPGGVCLTHGPTVPYTPIPWFEYSWRGEANPRQASPDVPCGGRSMMPCCCRPSPC